MKNGWEKEIIDPFNALIAPRTLMWKEKWGNIRCEWIKQEDGTLEDLGEFEQVIEEASKLCCMDCGRWNGWIILEDPEAAKVRKVWRQGWLSTLCQFCYSTQEEDNENQRIRDYHASRGGGDQLRDREVVQA